MNGLYQRKQQIVGVQLHTLHTRFRRPCMRQNCYEIHIHTYNNEITDNELCSVSKESGSKVIFLLNGKASKGSIPLEI